TGQTRRRRIAAPSSAGRESFTCVSSDWQYGQRIAHPRRILFAVGLTQIGVEREACAELLDLGTHSLLDAGIALVGVGDLEAVEHFRDQVTDLGELCGAEAAGRARRGAETDARGHERLLRVERDAVLVAGDVRTAESRLGALAGGVLRTQVNQHQVVVGAARDDVEASLLES